MSCICVVIDLAKAKRRWTEKKEKFSIFSSGPGLLLFCCFCFEAKRKSAGGFAGPPWFVRFLVWLFVLPKLRFCTLTFIQLFRTEPLTALREKKRQAGCISVAA